MINTQKIETFICAAENSSLAETARQLHLSQPTVGNHIKSLENELGVTLFVRSNVGVQLTEAGRLLLPWARRLLVDTRNLREMMASLQDEIVGEIRIACSTTAGKYILPQMAVRFNQQYSGIHVRILACGPEQATLNLLEGEAHLGVVSTEVANTNLESQMFFQDVITLIVPSNHRWASRTKIEPSALLDELLIMRERTSGTRRVVLTELAKHDISLDDMNIYMELGNAEAIVRTVAAGFGVSFVSSLALGSPKEQDDITEIEVEGMTLRRNIYMVRKRISAPHRPSDVFWSFIHDPANADLLKLAENQ
jgi:DNA-binding transcriptional LysR family regulator